MALDEVLRVVTLASLRAIVFVLHEDLERLGLHADLLALYGCQLLWVQHAKHEALLVVQCLRCGALLRLDFLTVCLEVSKRLFILDLVG